MSMPGELGPRIEAVLASGRFRVVHRLGGGATGEVFEAIDLGSRARVALKALRDVSPEMLRLFKGEFRAMQDIRHANLASLGELFEENGRWFFTMELVEGTDFIGYVSRGRAPPPPSTLVSQVTRRSDPPPASNGATVSGQATPFDEQRLRHALRQLVSGLRALHAAGKVHRDVKPSNVLVTRGGRVIVVDFGVLVDHEKRAIAGDDDIVGTPMYMAPEQASSGEVRPAADWYAVGVVLFQALTGRLPFEGSGIEVMSQKIAGRAAAPRTLVPGVPADLDALCVALLETDPAARPSGDEIARLLGVETEQEDVIGGGRIFVGRLAELAALREAFDAVRAAGSMVMFVEGESGVGKTEIVRRFTSELEATTDALVLRGRSYERESIPYEALDDALDDLSRKLRRGEASELALAPLDLATLRRTFPVLREVLAGPGPSVQALETNPRQQRARLFEAMRALMRRLAERSPLVVAIDDLHWADNDSIALLSELLRGPGEPRMLLVCTLRSETGVGQRRRDITRDIVASASRTRTVRVGKLPLSDAEELARELFKSRGSDAPPSGDALHRILDEAQGHPLFIDELVRQRRAGGTGPVSGEVAHGAPLDEVLWHRARALEPGARRFLELVAVVGVPVSQELVARAGGIPAESLPGVVRELQHVHLVRTSGDRGALLLAPYHDRVREAVVARLGEESLRSAHAQLAVAGEQEKDCDPEFLLAHWEGAGNAKRAGEYARTAAERAAASLAFEHAASLYRKAIASGAFDEGTKRALGSRLADVLTAAGREADSAQVRLDLAGDGTTTEALDLRRQAAEQLLRSGHFERGVALLREVLSRVHERFPESPLAVVFWLLVVRLQLRLRGFRFVERRPEALHERAAIRMDALWSAGAGLSMTDNIRGAYFQTKNLLQALKAGDLVRIEKALAMEVCFRSASGTKAAPTTLKHLAEAQALGDRVGTPEAQAMGDVAEGYAYYFFGDWDRAIGAFVRGEAIFRDQCGGVSWQLSAGRTMMYRALTFSGRLEELRQRHAAVLRDAVQRGDRQTVVNLKCSAAFIVALAGARPDDAARLLEESKADLPAGGFLVQHYFQLLVEVQLDLYRGRPREAHERLVAAAPRIRRSLLSRIASMAGQTHDLQARCALACAELDASGADPWIALARRHLEALRRTHVSWNLPVAALREAGALACAGARDESIAKLRLAIDALDGAGLRSFAFAARRRLAHAVGGDEGASLAAAAKAFETTEGIVDGEAFARLHAPGFARIETRATEIR